MNPDQTQLLLQRSWNCVTLDSVNCPLLKSPVAIESEVRGEERLQKLKNLLEKKEKLADADAATTELLSWLVRDKPLTKDVLEQIPCKDLLTIDRLWKHYSGGRFGFSVQQQVLKDVGGDLNRFGEQVGWKINGLWNSSYNYDFRAPKGHLPSSHIQSSILVDTRLGGYPYNEGGQIGNPIEGQPLNSPAFIIKSAQPITIVDRQPRPEPLAANMQIPNTCNK